MPVIALGQHPKRDSDAREYGDLLTVADVCTLTGLSAQTVRRCLERGELPGFKIGRRWFVPKSRLLDMGGRR
ncbi:helix-turn-helix domain-containing protein [uncultured Slackia sp.]|uniref:helix-turn-helix domain-containing protein n=1 Tax=uncultured Slackia sp. TaxID=665903 RepID=UPI0025D14D67|nr:helix-turn-helix domain-containing protein [uncultured Slackia sp.]